MSRLSKSSPRTPLPSESKEEFDEETPSFVITPTYIQEFLAKQRDTLQSLREEVTCVTRSPARAFQHRLLLNNLNVELLEQDLQSFLVFDHTLQDELGCLIDALVHRYTAESVHDRIRTTISMPKVIGKGKSSVFTSGLRGSNRLFVIKTAVVSNFECLYEYIVGKLIINPLRAELPNFMYTYGYHECANYETKDGKMIKWCTTDLPDMGYLYLEKIDGIRMDDFLQQYGEDTPEFAEVMLQIINALYLADARYSFRHGGLHEQNIMIRELGEPITIPFMVLGQKQYLRSRWIAQIIDFGDSRSVYNGTKLVSPIYFNQRGEDSKDFPYDLGYLMFSIMYESEEFRKLRTLYYRLNMDSKNKSLRTFSHIAQSFIEIFGDEAIISADQVTPSLPFTFIKNTYNFYQRYFIVRPYHPAEYYDLIMLINKYHLCDFKNWMETHAVLENIDIVQATRVIAEQVDMVIKNNSVSVLLRNEKEGIDIVLYDYLTNVNQVADYVYLLQSYCRMVLPLMRGYRFITARDEKYIRKVTQTISDKYQKLVDEAHRLYSATERAFLREGYSHSYYANDMVTLAWKLALLPQVEEM